MGAYSERVLPRIVDVACNLKEAHPQRRRVRSCQLTRPIVDLLRNGGFTITELDVYYEAGTPKAVGANSLGVARPS